MHPNQINPCPGNPWWTRLLTISSGAAATLLAGAALAQRPPAEAEASLPTPATSLPATEATLPANLPPAFAAALRAARLPANAVALHVQEVGSAKPSLTHNADKAMNPASVMKLITTYAGLELLGPSFV